MRMPVLRLSKCAARVIVCGVLVAGGSADGLTNGQPQSYETTFYPSGKLKIEAYVYKPEGTGPFPVVIYNHGSRAGHEREERPFVYVGEMLKHSGYLVIVPERRGYGESDGPTFGDAIGQDRGPRFVSRVQEETDDALAVVEFVKTLPYADTKRMAVMGWSIGGIVSVFAAGRSSAFRMAVDQAGGALTWDQSPAMRQALKEAAGKIRIPLLGMVAKNDRTTESVKAVVQEMEARGDREAHCVPRVHAPGSRRGSARAHDFWKGRLEDLGSGPAGVFGEVCQIRVIGEDAKRSSRSTSDRPPRSFHERELTARLR